MKKRILPLFLCFFLAVSLTGCGAGSDNEGQLSMSYLTSPPTVDPQLCSEVFCLRTVSLYMSTLYTYDETGKLVSGLAESYDVSTDGLTYTFHLKKGLKWNDGTPLTAHDFVFAFRRLADPGTGSGSVYLITDSCKVKHVEEVQSGKKRVDELGVSAPDENTFVVELEHPCPYFLSVLTSYVFSPCNEAFFKKCNGEYATSPETMLACGPYIMDQYEPLAVQIHFVPNPNYYDYGNNKNLPSEINIQVASNPQQALMCFDTGQLNVVSVNGELLVKLAEDPHLIALPAARLQFIQFGNLSQSAGKNVHIRRALGRSIDRDSIVNDYFQTGAYSLQRISPRGYYYETDGSDYSGDDKQYDDVTGYDPAAAKKEWEQGLQELGTKTVEMKLAFSSTEQNLCEILKQQMEKNLPGLSVKMLSLPAKEWLSALNKSQYDMIYQGWSADYADPTSFYDYWITGSRGDQGYSDPKVDQMLIECGSAETASNPEKRNKLLHKIEDRLLENMAMIPLFSQENCFMVSGDYSKFNLNSTATGYLISSLERQK